MAAAKEEMLSQIEPWCADSSLVVTVKLSENSRQGFERKKAAPHLGQGVCNSTTALGIERGLLGKCIGSRIQTWNRYAYVLNNPVSFTDPTGLDCVYIDNDTGKQTGFNTGDCDNSTKALANSGYYVDGTIVGGANGVSISEDGNWIAYTLQGNDFASGLCIRDCGFSTTVSSNPFTVDFTAIQNLPSTTPSPTDDPLYGTIKPGDSNGTKKLCTHQSNIAALEEILPGGRVLLGGDYSPSAVSEAAGEEVYEKALEAAGKSTTFLSMVRSWTGMPMTFTSKLLKGFGYTGTAVTAYQAMKAMQKEYKACMED